MSQDHAETILTYSTRHDGQDWDRSVDEMFKRRRSDTLGLDGVKPLLRHNILVKGSAEGLLHIIRLSLGWKISERTPEKID
jgi:hypothetical protein